jgi:hypothetical protein
MQFQSNAVFKRVKIIEEHVRKGRRILFIAGMKAQSDDSGGKILMGDNTGSGGGGRPYCGRSGSCVLGVWTGAGLPCMDTHG